MEVIIDTVYYIVCVTLCTAQTVPSVLQNYLIAWIQNPSLPEEVYTTYVVPDLTIRPTRYKLPETALQFIASR